MSKIFYSAATGGFYFDEDKDQYIDAGTLPDDLTEISEEEYTALFEGQAKGKVIVSSESGTPVLGEPVIDYLAAATQQRDSEMALASTRINALSEAQDDGDITPAEVAELTAWRVYRTALRRLDMSTAPEIIWPERP